MPASITINQPTHVMGPQGQILVTLVPLEDAVGFRVDLDFEHIKIGVTRIEGKHGHYTAVTFKQMRDEIP